MNPSLVNINSERFGYLWDIFQKEANKLASGIPCSAVSIYYTIYQIVSSGDISYSVRLHWCIGKFFLSLALKLRERIEEPDWVQKYADAFCVFEKTVELVDALSIHLNESIEENKECRKIRELGYIIWERCILRYRYEKGHPLLHDSLKAFQENAEVCLRSLKKIEISANDPLEYYRNNYETGLIGKAVAEFKGKTGVYTGKNLSEHLRRSSETIREIISEYSSLFLPVSFPILESSLEKSIFSGNFSDFRSDVRTIFKRESAEEIKALCASTSSLKMHVFPVFLEEIELFSSSAWPHSAELQNISEAYKRLSSLLAPTGCADTLQVLTNTLSKKIDRPGVGEKLSSYLELIIKQKTPEELPVFREMLQSVGKKEEKHSFYTLYIEKLSSRLLHLRFDPKMEKAVVISLSLPWTVQKKVLKIFEDMSKSSKENKAFCAAYGSPNFKYNLAQGPVSFYAVVTTACAWPIPEDSAHPVPIPESLREIVSAFEKQYLSKYNRRKLAWVDALSLVSVEIETDRIYTVEMSIYHYAVFEKIVAGAIKVEKIASDLETTTSLCTTAVESLTRRRLVCETPEGYVFNRSYTADALFTALRMEDAPEKRKGNRKPYYQAWISKKLKSIGSAALEILEKDSREEHTNAFEWKAEEYIAALKNLQERGLVEVTGNTAKYIP